MNGTQQIRFTDSAGKALFSIPDNGLLCLFYGNGDRHFSFAVIWTRIMRRLTA